LALRCSEFIRPKRNYPNMRPRVTFSTLACPYWSVETIVERAQTMGYDGIEWRGGESGHVNPTWSSAQRAALRQRMRDANLFSLAVTAYTAFVSDDANELAANLADLKRHLDLAADLDASFVRVFLGELTTGQTRAQVYPRIIEALQTALPHAHQVNVGIAIEHHDDFVRTADIAPILHQITDARLGAVWDIANAYSAGEAPEQGAGNLQNRISYVQLKDGVGVHENWRLTNLGAGHVPLSRAIELLQRQEYRGAYSIEWEYAWHPELDPPDNALPRALAYARTLLA